MDDAGGILAAVVCALLVFAIFPLLLWRRRSDAATATGDNHRLPPQPLEVPRILFISTAPIHVIRPISSTAMS
jgi:hypothetical protein